MGSALLELRDVVKEYPGEPRALRVLSGVSLEIAAGEAVAIVGPSGSGKSTLLNLIGTLDVPTSGSVEFKGRDISTLTERERALLRNRDIGFVFQFHHLLPQCGVLENVLLPTLVHKDAGDAIERAKHLLDRVGLSSKLHQLPGKLSGGERQRAAVVRALINRPSLLLADEPTGSLNREGAEDLTGLLLELNREEGMALVVVTHSMAVAERMGRVLELREGALG
ncbi:MAG: ABC transporter ATP-binding protein [FCB group bacterium]|jgi:ABC-type lipoprotein export system ATPase subunit|nr:ABC transporter ATP-binding protein [FCB group bacterium]